MSKTVQVYVKRQIRLDLLNFKQRQMYDLGNKALESIKTRVARAYGPNDAAAPPLKNSYYLKYNKDGSVDRIDLGYSSWANIKKGFGGRPIRDLEGNGMMLESTIRHYRNRKQKVRGRWKFNLKYVGHLMEQISVRKVSDNRAFIVEPTTIPGRIKARGNREMLGFSPRNCVEIWREGMKILGDLKTKMVKTVTGKVA